MMTLKIINYKEKIKIRIKSTLYKNIIFLPNYGRSSQKRYSLLELLEKNKIKIHYQCRSGYCGVCKILLLKGCVNYQKEPLACIYNNEILPCCCIPTEDLELEL